MVAIAAFGDTAAGERGPRTIPPVEGSKARGIALAEDRRWPQAIAEFARAVEEDPDDYQAGYLLALARLAADDLAGYRRACADLFARFGRSDDPKVASPLVYTCVAVPNAVADQAGLVRLGEKAVSLFRGNERALGAALYRAGRYDEALKALDEASRLTTPVAWDWLFLAMTHRRLGHGEEARAYLDRAARWIEEADRKPGQQPGAARTKWFNWNEPVEVHHLRREAEALLGTK